MRLVLSTLALVATTAAGAAADPTSVFVRAGSANPRDSADLAVLKDKKDAARKVYDDMTEALRKQYGKKPEAWPADKLEEWRIAHDTFFEAQTNWFYSTELKQQDIDDSMRELRQALADKGVVATADGPEDADFVVTVIGRAKVTNQDWGRNGVAAEIALRMESGARMDPASLAKAGAVWNEKESFWSKQDTQAVHRFTEAEPYWILISQKPGMGWMASYKAVAKLAAETIGDFAKANETKLASSRRASR
jgi:hypothetical protein